jgi:hypothetical protein
MQCGQDQQSLVSVIMEMMDMGTFLAFPWRLPLFSTEYVVRVGRLTQPLPWIGAD